MYIERRQDRGGRREEGGGRREEGREMRAETRKRVRNRGLIQREEGAGELVRIQGTCNPWGGCKDQVINVRIQGPGAGEDTRAM